MEKAQDTSQAHENRIHYVSVVLFQIGLHASSQTTHCHLSPLMMITIYHIGESFQGHIEPLSEIFAATRESIVTRTGTKIGFRRPIHCIAARQTPEATGHCMPNHQIYSTCGCTLGQMEPARGEFWFRGDCEGAATATQGDAGAQGRHYVSHRPPHPPRTPDSVLGM